MFKQSNLFKNITFGKGLLIMFVFEKNGTVGEYLKFHRHALINHLGLKRPFALKVDDMHEQIPKDTPEFDRYGLQAACMRAFVWKKLQETVPIIIKKLEEYLKILKKNPDAELEKLNYEELAPYKEVQQEQEKANQIYGDAYDLWFLDYKLHVEGLGSPRGCGDEINDAIWRHNIAIECKKEGKENFVDNFKDIVKELKLHIKTLKKDAVICRTMKQNIKRDFKNYVKQVNYYIKLSKKYGELQAKFDKYGFPETCEYNKDWYQHKNDSKLSGIVRLAIQEMNQKVKK